MLDFDEEDRPRLKRAGAASLRVIRKAIFYVLRNQFIKLLGPRV